jgi:hypothetical protein
MLTNQTKALIAELKEASNVKCDCYDLHTVPLKYAIAALEASDLNDDKYELNASGYCTNGCEAPTFLRLLEASDQPPQCDGFQYALGDGYKKCNICGTITAHFGRHDKGDKSQPPQLSESDEELLREAREGGKKFRATQADWELWIVDLKNRLALRVEQLAAELAKLENTFGERLAQGFNKEAEREHAQAMEYKGQLAVKDARIAALEAERDHLSELNELGKRCVSEGALTVMESNARIAALEAGIRQACKLLEGASSSEPPS